MLWLLVAVDTVCVLSVFGVLPRVLVRLEPWAWQVWRRIFLALEKVGRR